MGYNRTLHKLHFLHVFALRQVMCRVEFKRVVVEESRLSLAFFTNHQSDLSICVWRRYR
ncbi:hypothetical protein H0A36_25980 [Endozoicomonas sp. SM1973]|uniref:Uncharacterized protein n=1 Tax=Spartinivicinus marinus TaxID=2994442 RepID=A0A853I6C8_9GAMM|nr:hypothetical protein [Spartinivicinus marinus]NYZ69470.1 hypothetical protein [Spartinivicinus marinus]